MSDFYKELGGLEITVNLFKKYVVINRMIHSDKILVVISKKIPIYIALSLGESQIVTLMPLYCCMMAARKAK